MNGQTKSDTVCQRIEIWKENLVNFGTLLGLTELLYTEDVSKYFNLKAEEIKSLSVEDCIEGAYLLSQFALHIQKEYNKMSAITSKCDYELKRYVSDKVSQFQYASYEERIMRIIKEDSVAAKISEIKVDAESKKQLLQHVSNTINTLSNILLQGQRWISQKKN